MLTTFRGLRSQGRVQAHLGIIPGLELLERRLRFYRETSPTRRYLLQEQRARRKLQGELQQLCKAIGTRAITRLSNVDLEYPDARPG